MSKRNRKPFRGEINIFYFFLVALAIHLSFFIVKNYSVKGESNIGLRSNSAPISVQVKSETFKKPRPSVASAPQEEVKPEEVENTKEVKKEFESKIKDKKKEIKKKKKKKKTPQKKIEGKKEENQQKNTDSTPERPKNVPTDPNSDQDFLSGNFSIGTDGVVTASSADGIDYHILKQVDPEYPAQAKRVRYSKKVVVTVKFLVNLQGQIEDIKIIKSHKKLGFDKAVVTALKHRSEERRVGKECLRLCRSRWSPYH